MEAMKIIGLLFAFGVILLLDKLKLNATANKKKYSAVYYSTLAVGFIVGVLEIFNMMPDLNSIMIQLYEKITGSQ